MDTSYAFLKEIFFQEEVRSLWMVENLQFFMKLFFIFQKTLCTRSANGVFCYWSVCSNLIVFWSLYLAPAPEAYVCLSVVAETKLLVQEFLCKQTPFPEKKTPNISVVPFWATLVSATCSSEKALSTCPWERQRQVQMSLRPCLSINKVCWGLSCALHLLTSKLWPPGCIRTAAVSSDSKHISRGYVIAQHPYFWLSLFLGFSCS